MREFYLTRNMSVRTDIEKAWALDHLCLALTNQEICGLRDRANGLFEAALNRGMVIS